MESQPTTQPPITAEDKPKSKKPKGPIILSVVCIIIALAGIGFGVYGMLQSAQKDTDISNLKTQVQNLNNTIATSQTTTPATPDNTTPNTTAENTQDYIYIGEWGIKIKIPATLKNVGYSFGPAEQSRPDSISLSVTGVPADFEVEEGLPEFATVGKGIAGSITMSQGDCGEYCNYVVFEKGDTKFFYWGPHVAYGADGSNDPDPELGRKTQELIFDMLRNSDNYSTF